jgi:hypothetical protein
MNRLSTFVSFTQWLQSVVQLYVIGHKSSVVCVFLVSTVTYRVKDGCRKTGKFATEHVCSKKKFCKHVCVHTRARTSLLQLQPSYCNSLWKPWFLSSCLDWSSPYNDADYDQLCYNSIPDLAEQLAIFKAYMICLFTNQLLDMFVFVRVWLAVIHFGQLCTICNGSQNKNSSFDSQLRSISLSSIYRLSSLV